MPRRRSATPLSFPGDGKKTAEISAAKVEKAPEAAKAPPRKSGKWIFYADHRKV